MNSIAIQLYQMLCVCFAINISHDISHNISLEDLIIPSFQYMYLITENFNFYLVFRVKFSLVELQLYQVVVDFFVNHF